MGRWEEQSHLIKLRLRASEVRLGDRLVGVEGQPHRIVVQVRRLAREVRLSHGGADETRLVGDPLCGSCGASLGWWRRSYRTRSEVYVRRGESSHGRATTER